MDEVQHIIEQLHNDLDKGYPHDYPHGGYSFNFGEYGAELTLKHKRAKGGRRNISKITIQLWKDGKKL